MKLPVVRRRQDRELDDEIRSHLKLAIADRVERGETPEQAARAARREFGNVTVVKEVTREMWGWTAIEQLLQDVQYGWRALRKAPGFALVAIATFALGIGVNTAMFSVINAVMLRPLPFPRPERLVDLSGVDKRPEARIRSVSDSWPDFFDWRARARSFEHLAAYNPTAFTMMLDGRAVHVPGAVVSSNIFSTLGVQPAIGRAFRLDEERAGSDVAVISDTLWRSEFGAAAGVVGTTTSINSRPFTIVGVMPPGFRYPISSPAPLVWITVAEHARGADPMTTQRGAHFIKVLGRLRAGVPVAAARAEMDAIAAAQEKEFPEDNAMRGIEVTPELERLVGDTRQPLLMLLVAVGCVLLIACANLANLLLVRGASRGQEMALRLALGASRRRIIRQLLTESAVLSAAGTAVGLILAAWSVRLLVQIAPAGVRGLDELSIDGPVLAFTALVGLISALAFGTLPAVAGSRTDPRRGFDADARATSGRGHGRLRSALAIAETAIGVVLLVGAGLLLRGFYRLSHTDPGFDPSRIVTLKFNVPESRYPYLKNIALYDQLLADLNGVPGLEATMAAPLPLGGSRFTISFEPPGAPTPQSRRPSSELGIIGPGYFREMRIPFIGGRDFTAADNDAAPRVVIVNQSFARQFLPGRDPVGQRIRPSLSTTEKDTPWREVVGVVADVKQRTLDEAGRPQYFIPYAQGLATTLFLVMRTTRPAAAAEQAREAIARRDPELAIYDVRTMDEIVAQSTGSARFQTLLLTLFAALALVLTAVGLYGVVACGVAQRTREFGIRLALGADPRGVLRLVLAQGLRMALIGVSVGLVAAAFATHLLGAVLYGVGPLDPATFAAVVVTLLLVALMASFVPARRATRVDPIRALRAE